MRPPAREPHRAGDRGLLAVASHSSANCLLLLLERTISQPWLVA
jgi:hypothetical protein